MSVAMFRAPAGYTPKSTSGFVTILAARKQGLEGVFAALEGRREHPGLAQHALWALADLMEMAPADQAEPYREKVVLAALETMRAHRNHGAIQQNGIRALASANSNSDASTEKVLREGAVAAVISAMQKHADCRQSGWSLLVQLGEYQSLLDAESGPDGADGQQPENYISPRAELVVCVLRAMAVHLPRLIVQQAGVKTIAAAIAPGTDDMTGAQVEASERVTAVEAIIGVQGIATVLKSLQTHAAQDDVQQGGMRLLRECCDASEQLSAFTGRAVAAHPGGIGAVLDVMRGSVRVASTLSDGLVVLAAITLASENGHATLVQAGAVRVAAQSMHCHESEVSVQSVGLRLLAALAAEADIIPALLRENAMRSVLHGLRIHAKSDANTAAAACLCLARFSRHCPKIAAESLSDDWEVLCEQVVTEYGVTYAIAEHIAESVPILRQHFDPSLS